MMILNIIFLMFKNSLTLHLFSDFTYDQTMEIKLQI